MVRHNFWEKNLRFLQIFRQRRSFRSSMSSGYLHILVYADCKLTSNLLTEPVERILKKYYFCYCLESVLARNRRSAA